MRNGTTYFLGSEKLSYLEAAQKCLKLGLNLVSIETSEKLRLVMSIATGIAKILNQKENLIFSN